MSTSTSDPGIRTIIEVPTAAASAASPKLLGDKNLATTIPVPAANSRERTVWTEDQAEPSIVVEARILC
jgi:hypothetical protein